VQHYRTCTSRFAADGDSGRVAAKLADVLLHPFQGESLVEKTGVGSALVADLGGRKETKCAQTVLNFHRDESVVVGVHQRAGIIQSAEQPIAATIYQS
jgi:hypothetical protein